jgi:hypothetical protein
MYFGTKSYLKSNRYHTAKHTIKFKNIYINKLFKKLFYQFENSKLKLL